tara:strand:+ start:330 stop:488 length:159 start_codon:yes stop_codon:yes gene_type:complete
MTGLEDLLRVRKYSIESLQSELIKANDKVKVLEAKLEIMSKELEYHITNNNN